MSAEDVIDTSDGVSVDWGDLASLLLGTVFMGWLLGIVGWLNAIYSGISSSIILLSEWIRDGLISETLDIPISAMSLAWNANIEWISTFGAFAPVVAMLQMAVIGWFIAWITLGSLRLVSGVF